MTTLNLAHDTPIEPSDLPTNDLHSMPQTAAARVIAQQVNAQGLNCPMPLLKLRQALHAAVIGQYIRVLTTDHNSQTDIGRYCQLSGHTLCDHWQMLNDHKLVFAFDIEKTH